MADRAKLLRREAAFLPLPSQEYLDALDRRPSALARALAPLKSLIQRLSKPDFPRFVSALNVRHAARSMSARYASGPAHRPYA